MKVLIIITAICIVATGVFAQQKETLPYPRTGYQCPDFTLRNIEYFQIKHAAKADFKGKWLVLDFWNKYCTSCINSFPKINALQKEFKGKVQFMMVGREDRENQIRKMYAKFKKNMDLEMACAFDSILPRKWDYMANPTIIVIDPEGIVRGITYTLTSANLRDFLEGKQPKLAASTADRDLIKFPFEYSKPMFVDNNAGDGGSTIYQSNLSRWTAKTPNVADNIEFFVKVYKGRFSQLGLRLDQLYKLAYFGTSAFSFNPTFDPGYYGNFVPQVQLNIRDSLNFIVDDSSQNGRFCYDLTYPPERTSKTYIMNSLKQDLHRWFGYDVKVETCKMPYWRLVANDKGKKSLPTKGGAPTDLSKSSKYLTPHDRYKIENLPLSNLIYRIAYHNIKELPILDETGISGNIDIDMDCVFSDMNEVKRELMKNGLDLVKGEKDMKVLVISDPKRASEESK